MSPPERDHTRYATATHAMIAMGKASRKPLAKLRPEAPPSAALRTCDRGNLLPITRDAPTAIAPSNRMGSCAKFCDGCKSARNAKLKIYNLGRRRVRPCSQEKGSFPRLPRHLRLREPHSLRPTSTARTIGLAGVLASISGPVTAQKVETPETLILQSEPQGIRAGGGILYPQLDADLVYDSNIFNRAGTEIEDAFARIRGRVVYRLDLARHDLDFEAGTDVRRYFDITTENNEQYWVRANGVLELPDQQRIFGNVAASRLIEPRGTLGDQLPTGEPIAFFEKRALIGYSRERGLITVSADLQFSDRDFEDAEIDGTVLDLSGWDVRRLRGQTRVSYQLGPVTKAFATASVTDLNYEIDTLRQDSTGYSVLAGLQWKPNEISSIEGAIGYLAQDFGNPDQDFGGIDFYIRADWTPIPRLRVFANAERSAERSALLDVPAVIQSRLDAGLQFALGGRTIVGSLAGIQNDNYRGIERRENRVFVDFNLRHRVIENLELTAGAGWRRQWAVTDIGREYSGFSVRAGARLRF